MDSRKNSVSVPIAILSVIVIVLAAGFAYCYYSSQNQIKTLRQDGHSYCLTVASESVALSSILLNITETMQKQVQTDSALIAALNSTRPAGYQGMVSTLNSQISQDLGIVSRISPATAAVGQVQAIPTQSFCAEVNQP